MSITPKAVSMCHASGGACFPHAYRPLYHD